MVETGMEVPAIQKTDGFFHPGSWATGKGGQVQVRGLYYLHVGRADAKC